MGGWGLPLQAAKNVHFCYACGRLTLAVNGFSSFQSVSF